MSSRSDMGEGGELRRAAGVGSKVGVLGPAGGAVPLRGGSRGKWGACCTGMALAAGAVALHICLGGVAWGACQGAGNHLHLWRARL